MISYRPFLEAIHAPKLTRCPFITRLDEIEWLPLAENELLLSSHHFVICIRFEDGCPRVGFIVSSRFLNSPINDGPQAWKLRYVPLALRAYPFSQSLSSDPSKEGLLVADDPADASARVLFTLFNDDKSPTPYFQSVTTALTRVAESAERLTQAANRLLISDVLVPIGHSERDRGDQLMVLDVDRFSGLSPRSIAALAQPDFTSIDLAGALAFSEVKLKASAKRQPTVQTSNEANVLTSGDVAPWMVPWLDMSDLFPSDLAPLLGRETAGATDADLMRPAEN